MSSQSTQHSGIRVALDGSGAPSARLPSQLELVPAPPDDRSDYSAAFARRLREIAAVPDTELVLMNLDVYHAAAIVLGSIPRIATLAPEIAALSPCARAAVEGLEDYALAACEADSRYATAPSVRDDISRLNAKALALRDLLRSDVTALAHRGLIEPTRLVEFRGWVGYENVALELIGYVNLLRQAWPTIRRRTAVTKRELAHAKIVAWRLMRAAKDRARPPAAVREAARVRRQALTLMVRAYAEVRRAIIFVRGRANDVDSFAPSLYAGRGGRGKSARRAPSPEATVRCGN